MAKSAISSIDLQKHTQQAHGKEEKFTRAQMEGKQDGTKRARLGPS